MSLTRAVWRSLGWLVSGALTLAFGLSLGACAAPATSIPPGTVFLSQAEVDRLRSGARELAALRTQNAALERRVATLEQRVGVARFTPRALRPIPGVTLSPKGGVYVASASAPSAKRRLTKHLAGFDGYVVAYWATWCKPCTSPEELDRLRDLQHRLRKSNIELVSVLIDDLRKARSDPRAPGWLYPFWFREDGHLDMLPRAFIERVGLNLPLFLVVAPTGEVRWFYNSALTDESMAEIVTATARVCRQP